MDLIAISTSISPLADGGGACYSPSAAGPAPCRVPGEP